MRRVHGHLESNVHRGLKGGGAGRLVRNLTLVFLFLNYTAQTGTRWFEVQAVEKVHQQSEDATENVDTQEDQLPRLGLPISANPKSIISFNINDKRSQTYPSGPRLAVLYYDEEAQTDKVVIFRP